MSPQEVDPPRSLWLQPQDPPPRVSIEVRSHPQRVVIAPARGTLARFAIAVALNALLVPILIAWIRSGVWGGVVFLAIWLLATSYALLIRPALRASKYPAVAILDNPRSGESDKYVTAPEFELPANRIRFVELALRQPRYNHADVHFELGVNFSGWPNQIVIQRCRLWQLKRVLLLAESLVARWDCKLIIHPAVVQQVRKPSAYRWGIGLVVLLSLLSTSSGILIGWTQLRLRQWTKVDAKIVEFEPGEKPIDEGGPWYANPKIRYQYMVDGRAFVSQGWNPSPFNYQSSEDFEADTRGFAVGATIPCWCDPGNPRRSFVVNNGLTIAPVLLCLIGLTLLTLLGWDVQIRRQVIETLDHIT